MALISSWRAAGTLKGVLLEFLRRKFPLGPPLVHAKYRKHEIRQLGFLLGVANSGAIVCRVRLEGIRLVNLPHHRADRPRKALAIIKA